MKDLRSLVENRRADPQALIDDLNANWLPAAVTRYNSEFGPRYFGRPETEKVPTDPLLFTSFRARLGGLLEYGLGVVWDEILKNRFGKDLRLSFAVAHEYPDFYMRGSGGETLLRIDSKLLHDESAEKSARFTLHVDEIDGSVDLLWYGAWQWRVDRTGGFVYPHVLETLIVPAIAIARERDARLVLTGGWFEDQKPIASSGNLDTNFGKIDRIVHHSRIGSKDLDPSVRAFLDFLKRNEEAVERAASDPKEVITPTPDEVDPQVTEDDSPPSTA